MRHGLRTSARWKEKRRGSPPSTGQGCGGKKAAPRRSDQNAADRGREFAEQEEALAGLERWKTEHPEAAELSPWMMYWSTRCAGARPRGRASRQPAARAGGAAAAQETPDPDDDPTREWRPGRKRTKTEPMEWPRRIQRARRKNLPINSCGRHDFQLRIGAVGWASCRCASGGTAPCAGSARPACARMPLRPPVRGAAAPTRDPCRGSIGFGRRACAAPARRCGLARPSPSTDDRRAHFHDRARGTPRVRGASPGEARADADVLQRAGSSNRPSSSEPICVPLALFVPAEAGDHAIAIAFVLDLEHDALVGFVNPSTAGLAMTPSRPAPSKRRNQSAAMLRSMVAGVRWIGRDGSRACLQLGPAVCKGLARAGRDLPGKAGRRTPPRPASGRPAF